MENPLNEAGVHMESFLTNETWDGYLARMACDSVWGDHIILQAICNITKIQVKVYNPSIAQTVLEPVNGHVGESFCVVLGHVSESHFVSLRKLDWEKNWITNARLWCSYQESQQKENFLKYLKQKISLHELKIEVCSLLSHLPGEVRSLPLRKRSSAPTCLYNTMMNDEHLPEHQVHNVDEGKPVDMDNSDNIIQPLGCLLKNANYIESEYIRQLEDLKTNIMSVDVAKYSDDMWRDIKLSLNESTECEDVTILVQDKKYIDRLSTMPMGHLSFFMKVFLPREYCTVSSMVACVPGSIYVGGTAEHLNYQMNTHDNMTLQQSVQIKPSTCAMVCDCENYPTFSKSDGKPTDVFFIDTDIAHAGYAVLKTYNGDRIPRPKLPKKYAASSHKYVAGIDCFEFPDVALEWVQRERPSDWPKPELMNRLANETHCMLIGRPHPHSMFKDDEWQIIFPTIEKLIAKEGLNDSQTSCFRCFKIIVNYHTKDLPFSPTTTHIKTVMYYACERIPLSSWDENQGGCLIYLLELLQSYLSEGNLPNYFIKDNNMIDHIPKNLQKDLLKIISALRQFPAIAISIVFDAHGYDQCSWRADSVFDDIPRYRIERDFDRSVKTVFIPARLETAFNNIDHGYNEAACSIMQDTYQMVIEAETGENKEPHPDVQSFESHPDFSSSLSAGPSTHPASLSSHPAVPSCKSAVPSFEEFVIDEVLKEDNKTKFSAAYVFDQHFEMHIMEALRKQTNGPTFGDLLKLEDEGLEFELVPIPKKRIGHLNLEIKFINRFAHSLYWNAKYEKSALLLRSLIAYALESVKFLEEDIAKCGISERKELSQIRFKAIQELLEVYNQLQMCYSFLQDACLFQEYIDDYERLCDDIGGSVTHYTTIMYHWKSVGAQERLLATGVKLNKIKGFYGSSLGNTNPQSTFFHQ